MEKQIDFNSIQDGAIDITIASGELMFNIFSSLAQFERRLIQEGTKAGLVSAHSEEKIGARPKIGKTILKYRRPSRCITTNRYSS